MSGVWNTATLDITIPSDGSLTPGSGTVYIGGPQLPTEIKSVFPAAIVFYSTIESAVIKYWFIAHSQNGTISGLVHGYVDVAGGVRYLTDQAFYDTATADYGHRFTDGGQNVLLQVQGRGTDLVYDLNLDQTYWTTGANLRTGPAVNGNDVYIKSTKAASTQDEWTTDSSTQTITGVAGCTVRFMWRWTPDYLCEVRFFVQVPGGGLPAVPTFSSFAYPVGLPPVDLGPGGSVNQGPHWSGNYTAGAAQGSVNGRLEVGNAYFFGTPVGLTTLEGSATYTVAKP